MLRTIKRRLYFVVARYFAFWAKFVLRRWKPRIVLVTGSSGKTTLLHMIEAQLGTKALYSHHANSAIGIPFHILGLDTNIASRAHWLSHILQAPFKAWQSPPMQKIYVVEADCDRPNEGKFLASLLKPEAVLWVSVYRTHTANFDSLVADGTFPSHEAAIAYEFGNYIAQAQRFVAVNADQPELVEQLKRVKQGVEVKKVSMQNLTKFTIAKQETIYEIGGEEYSLPGIHPREAALSVQLANELLAYLHQPVDTLYTNLIMPPSRSSVFAGKNNTTLVDSSYNTGLGAMTAMLQLFNEYPAEHKWVILGDILEQGSKEEEEHQNLAEVVIGMKIDRAIFLGPRTKAHTYPLVKEKLSTIPVESFESPKEVLEYLNANLQGGEALFFKGGRFLEGVIEQLLADPAQASQLARREEVWVKRRQQWGLPR